MIMHFLKTIQDWFSRPIDGYGGLPPVRGPIDPVHSDGRAFAWIRARSLPAGCYPTILRDKSVGPKLEIIGERHVLLPREYDDDLEMLIARYPVPKFERD